PPPTDEQTLCRTDQPLAAHTIILVDATDKLEPRHRRLLRAVVRQEGQRLARYQRLTLLSLRADRPQEPRILFSLCNPGDGQSVNPLFQNTRLAQARWESAFGEALDRAVRRAAGARAASASPILAGLRAIAADPDFTADVSARRLVLVSDMLEFTPGGFSLYGPQADFTHWRAISPLSPPDLTGVQVRVAALDRPGHEAEQAHARDAFWAPYFDAAGARETRFDPAP
ncbi:MAG: hypothetical protein AB7L65_02110, partial [Hyphomonadaceae bacterium]